MAFTQQQYDTLIDAISQGALLVKYADKEVRYRSLDDMLRIAKLMATQLGLVPANNGRTLVEYNNGIKPGCSDDERWIR